MLLAAGFATIPLERVSDLDPVAVAEIQAYIAARADVEASNRKRKP